ncbi:hypothetical protein VE03_01043 [Pseudogymnoascus sp. 23342-1-I1]|nr:hypothetical protein VE03_01043 [Pseudogymnoascus sp. 23342-1-I1]
MADPAHPRRKAEDKRASSPKPRRRNSIIDDITSGTQVGGSPAALPPQPHDAPRTRPAAAMDWSQPLPIIKALAPKVPMIGKTALMHTLGLSETSKYWDLRTAITINVIRSFVLTPLPTSVGKSQHLSLRDPGVKGKVWIANVSLPSDDDDVRQAIFGAIDYLAGAPQGALYAAPELAEVTAEWTGYRAGATSSTPPPDASDASKYAAMMKEVVSPTTVLYLHGGAYYLMDPATHRPTTARLAKHTTGRVLSIRYRLAPQHPFPAPLIDALVAYLSLLYPPPGSLHTAVPPEHIVVSGDSAGGNLATSLLLLLLTLQRQSRTVLWGGLPRSVPLPAGTALVSPWMDITGSSPSCADYAHFDYLPGRAAYPNGMEYAPDAIWPVTPARTALHVDDALLLHPLVSPLAAKEELWAGAPPVWMVTGWELLSDEDRAVAGRMVRAGVRVRFWEFEAMPHCFAMVVEGSRGARKCVGEWAGWMRRVVEGEGEEGGTVVRCKGGGEREVDVRGLDVGWEVTMGRMRERVRRNEERKEAVAKL